MCHLSELAATQQPVDFDRYARLHGDGRTLIRGWVQRSVAGRRGGEPSFESFIYLWIAFNGWAACVAGKDGDRDWQETLIADPSLNERFDQLSATPTRTAAAAPSSPSCGRSSASTTFAGAASTTGQASTNPAQR